MKHAYEASDRLPLGVDVPVKASPAEADPELDEVVAALKSLDGDGSRFARALRRTIDMLLDGQNTGRYRWDQLYKTEKTHAGTLVEINLQREFGFAGGDRLDYCIAGIEVDCKFSQTRGGWMIPPEAIGGLCLLVWASDQDSRWCAGLVQVTPERLNRGGNRDSKHTLNVAGRAAIVWLFPDAPLPENVLLRLSAADQAAIWAHDGPRDGQRRVNELFRRAQNRPISRTAVATVAMQADYMKRVRYDGGARSGLQPEGIVILGGDFSAHRTVAETLQAQVPGKGEFVSLRLATAGPQHNDRPSVVLDGKRWVIATPGDPPERAPMVPDIRRRAGDA